MKNNFSKDELITYIWKKAEDSARYYENLSRIMHIIHQEIPEEKHCLSRAATKTDIREENFHGVNYERAVIYLLTNGCEWALKDGNGCTMCGHLAKQTKREIPISTDDYIQQFKSEFDTIDFRRYPILNVYNNGSIFNEYEISGEAVFSILKLIAEKQEIKMLVIESRPEFITEEKIMKVKSICGDIFVEVAVGLELKDDYLRQVCINKGFSLRQYDKAAKIVRKHLNLRTYVLLKPPFLSEKEAIEQAIKTVQHAFLMGSSTVSLEACTVQDYTLVKYLSDRKQYRPAWLWSIIEVIRRTSHMGKIIIGLFQFYPSPTNVPCNCPKCNHKVMDAMKAYNRTLDIGVFDDIDCECRKEWEKMLAEQTKSFEERLKIINQL